MYDGIIQYNASNVNAPYSGGGVLVVGANSAFTMEGGIIRNNHSNGAGGGVLVAGHQVSSPSFDMRGGTIAGNHAASGGGVAVWGCTAGSPNGVAITNIYGNAKIIGNTAQVGGGIEVHNRGTLNIFGDALIYGNTARFPIVGMDFLGHGGGVNLRNGDNTVIMSENVQIEGNDARLGGGVHILSGTFALQSGEIIDNEADSDGGGVFVHSTHANAFIMTGGTIEDNEAGNRGGGVFQNINTTFTLQAGTISDNDAENYGGGIYLRDGANLNMTGGTITNNEALTGDGGGIYLEYDANMNAANAFITNNTAAQMGGGIFTERHEYENPLPLLGEYTNIVTASNVVFAGNSANAPHVPPSNASMLTDIEFTSISIHAHPLNNFDINYMSDGAQAPVPFRFNKLNLESAAFVGAQFRLERSDGQGGWDIIGPVAVASTAPDGLVSHPDWILSRDGQYRLREVSVPAGPPFYQLPPGYWAISVNAIGNIVINNMQGNLPFNTVGGNDNLSVANRPYPEAILQFIKTDNPYFSTDTPPFDPSYGERVEYVEFQLFVREWDATGTTYTWEPLPGYTGTSDADGRVEITLPDGWFLPDPNRSAPAPHPYRTQFKLAEVYTPTGFVTPTGHWIITPIFDYILQRVEFDIVLYDSVNDTRTPIFLYLPHAGPIAGGFMAPIGFNMPIQSQYDIYSGTQYYVYDEGNVPPPMSQQQAAQLFEHLEDRGILERVHGGVVIHTPQHNGPFMPFNENAGSWVALNAAVQNAPTDGSLWTIYLTASFVSATGQGTITIGANQNILLTSQGAVTHTWTHTTTGRHFHLAGTWAGPARLTLYNVTLSGNQELFSHNHGGVSMTAANTTLTMNANSTIENNRAGLGGGVFGDAGSILIMNAGSTIQNNVSSGNGGGVQLLGFAAALTRMYMYPGSLVTGNHTGIHGGGVCLNGANAHLIMHGGTISRNTAVSQAAGVRVSGTFIMHDGVIGGATPADGNVSAGIGTIFLQGPAAVMTMHNGTISNNVAGAGGAVNVEYGVFTMNTGATISYNIGISNAGGVRISGYTDGNTGIFVMNGGSITGNRTNGPGGGVFVNAFIPGNRFYMHGGSITNNRAGGDGGGIFTWNHRYTDPIIPGAGNDWTGIYSNIQISATNTVFSGNQARRWFYPPSIPDNGDRLPNVPWTNNTSSISSGSGPLYLLNNYDINFNLPIGNWFVGNVPTARFRFHKADQELYTLYSAGNGTLTPANWTTINTDHLLAGAKFELFRWNGTVSPPAGAVVNPSDPGPNWTRVWYGTTTDLAGSPRTMYLDSRDTYFQLVEIMAPAGFNTPLGQWRIILSDDCDCIGTSVCAPTGDGFYFRIVGIMAPPPFIHNPGNGIWYVGNHVNFELPLAGSSITRSRYMMAGMGVLAMAGVGMAFIYLRDKKGWQRL